MLFFSVALLLGCNALAPSVSSHVASPCPPAMVLYDTIRVPDTQCQILLEQTTIERDSFALIAGNGIALEKRNDSLYSALLVANFKLERVAYYTAIVGRNPSQIKYLRGWNLRALKGE